MPGDKASLLTIYFLKYDGLITYQCMATLLDKLGILNLPYNGNDLYSKMFYNVLVHEQFTVWNI